MTVVLVVDDEPSLRDLVQFSLEGAGYRVVTAPDGAAALALLAASRPDVIVSDVMMPVLDGRALCRAVKADPALAAIPVILTSAAGAAAVRDAPCDFFIPKPFDIAALLGILAGATGRDTDLGA